MAMHKGMCGRSEPDATGPASTLGGYLTQKYPEEMKKKLTFDEWWRKFTEHNPRMGEDFWTYSDYKTCWFESRENV